MKKSHRCQLDQHDYPDTPRTEYAGYQQTPDGREVDGKWQTFICSRCGHSTERWQPAAADPAAAGVNTEGAWAMSEKHLAPPPPRSLWDRPLLLWLLGILVLLVACYGYYWDSHVNPTAHSGTVFDKQASPGQ